MFRRPWLAVGLAIAAVAVSGILRDLAVTARLDGLGKTMLISVAATLPLVAAIIAIPRLTSSGRMLRVLRLVRPLLPDILLGVSAGVVIRAVTELVSPTASVGAIGGQPALPLLLSLAIAVLVSPFVEEALFRGVLQRSLANGFVRSGTLVANIVAIVMTTAVFVAAHISFGAIQTGVLASTIIVGVVCGTLTATTGRLGAAIAAHAVHNAIGAVLMLV